MQIKRCLAGFLVLAGCAAPTRIQEEKPLPVSFPIHEYRVMAVFVPQTDEAATSWMKWFTKYPELKLVIAVSPRFQSIAKDPKLKAQFQALQKDGRLVLALQIPNAPILPLLINTESARDALLPGSELPSPPYAYPDDVTQLVALAKAEFFKQWNFLPRGLVLPYGAADPKLISIVERLGFSWTVGALGAPVFDGPYVMGSLAIWDATPAGSPLSTRAEVWDERIQKASPLETWVRAVREKKGVFMLPDDTGWTEVPLRSETLWSRRTWTEGGWSAWIGDSAKNAAWSALRKTREALEQFKNSGQASIHRLDAAFSELYSAQNSNYFAAMGPTPQSPATAEERQHEFQATLSGVYRLIKRAPPDDLFETANLGATNAVTSATSVQVENLSDGREHLTIQDAVGDAMGGPDAPDLANLQVWSLSDGVHWTVTLASAVPATIDIYVDLNGQPNAGMTSLLPGRGYFASPKDAWEYAISFSGQTATLYRTQGVGTYGVVQTFPVAMDGNRISVAIPSDIMHGSPRRWGFQVLTMEQNASGALHIADFIDPLEITQRVLWDDLTAHKRGDIPFVRIRR